MINLLQRATEPPIFLSKCPKLLLYDFELWTTQATHGFLTPESSPQLAAKAKLPCFNFLQNDICHWSGREYPDLNSSKSLKVQKWSKTCLFGHGHFISFPSHFPDVSFHPWQGPGHQNQRWLATMVGSRERPTVVGPTVVGEMPDRFATSRAPGIGDALKWLKDVVIYRLAGFCVKNDKSYHQAFASTEARCLEDRDDFSIRFFLICRNAVEAITCHLAHSFQASDQFFPGMSVIPSQSIHHTVSEDFGATAIDTPHWWLRWNIMQMTAFQRQMMKRGQNTVNISGWHSPVKNLYRKPHLINCTLDFLIRFMRTNTTMYNYLYYRLFIYHHLTIVRYKQTPIFFKHFETTKSSEGSTLKQLIFDDDLISALASLSSLRCEGGRAAQRSCSGTCCSEG